MAKCNSTKNNRNGLKVFAIIVSILLVVCLVASLCVIGRTTNGFKEIPEFDDEVEEDPFVVDPEDDDEANNSADTVGVKLYAEKIPEEDYDIMGLSSDTIGVYTVTASYEPSNADIKDFSWSLALDTSWSGYRSSGDYTDYYGTVWSSSADFKMSDYITLSGDDTLSVTVTCNQLFGCPIILTFEISDVLGNSVSSDCCLNCNTYKTGFYWKSYSSNSCSVSIDIENTDPVEDQYVDAVFLYEFIEDRVSYSFSSRVFSVDNGLIDVSNSMSMDSRLVSVWYDSTLSSVSNASGETGFYVSSLNFYCFGNKFLSGVSKAGTLQSNFSTSYDDYYFKNLFCYLEPVFDEVYSVGTLSCSQSDSSALSSLDVSYSVKSGVDDSVLVSSTSCTSTVSFSVDSCLSKITDSNGVYLTRENLGLGKVSSSFMKQFCDSSHPILNIDISCGSSSCTIPFYFSDILAFNVGLTGAFVDSSNLVFN